MKNNQKYGVLLSFIDMLYAMLMAVFSLFILSFLLINVKKNQQDAGKVDTDAQLEIVMTWQPDGIANDIDLWVKPPTESPIGYSHLENTYMYLARDDLGEANDYAIINGKRQIIEGHNEVTSIRKVVPGHYVVNAEYYAAHIFSSNNVGTPTFVTIKLIQINPYKVLVSQSFTLQHQSDQHTAFSFDIDEKNNVYNINTATQDPFIVLGNSNPEDPLP